MESLLKDMRYGVRMLVRSPGFTVVALLAITLGIGANTTIFSAMDATLFHPFAFPNQDRLVMLWERNPELGFTRGSVSPGNAYDWREQNQTLEQTILIDQRFFDLTESDEPERFNGYTVSAGFFDALGVSALHGRTFAPDEDQPGRDQVVVLKYNLWQRRFNADPGIINRTVRLNGMPFTVIGVMPKDFNFPFNGGEMWAPMAIVPQAKSNRGNHFLQVMGVLKPGVTIERASEDLNAIAARAAAQFPETNAGRGVTVMTITADATRGARMYAPVMLGAVGFVLLIACANVANLLLVRGASRQKEMAIRLAMGASRWRLMRQLLTESMLLSLAGGVLGLLLSIWGIQALWHSIPDDFSKFIPGWQRSLAVNRTALLFTFIVSVITGLLCGLIPALQSTKMNFNEALKEGGKGTSGKMARNRARNGMVVAEIALSLTLLIGAGLMIRSFIELLRSDFGVDPTNVLTFQLSLPNQKYPTDEARGTAYNQLLSRLEALPGVARAGGIGNLPMNGNYNSHTVERIGPTVYERGKQPNISYAPITPGYLATAGTRLIRGRNVTDQDLKDKPFVALVDEAFVKQYLPDQDPIGQQIKESGNVTREIIGVTATVMNGDFEERAEAHIYTPYAQDSWRTIYLVIRGNADPAPLTAGVRNVASTFDKTLPVFNVKPMQQVIDERMSPKRLATGMMLAFALVALALAAVGIYAVMSYSVSQRINEIGIRIALGAQSRDIFKLIVGQGLLLTVLGLAFGLGGAFGVTRAMAGLLYGVTTTDVSTYVGISLLLALIALLACYVPARRATKVDPMVALRYE